MTTQPHEHFHLAESKPSDWKYVAEGGSTLVLSYVGETPSKFSGLVLRLRKADIHTVFEESAQFWSEPDDPIVQFQAEVIEHLLPYDYLPHFRIAEVERGWLEDLAKLVEPRRPESRKKKDRIDSSRHKAVLATDLIGRRGWAIEIKPKWGFLPNPTYLSNETRPIKSRTCRFCMHAHHRTVTKGERPPLGYCPLDLYSGKEERVVRAIHGLWDGWVHSEGHANNLRVFVGGKLIDPTKEHSLASLSAEILSDTSSDVTPYVDLRERFTELVSKLVLSSPVFPTLSRLQRTLDSLDIEGIHLLLSRAGMPFSKELILTDPEAHPRIFAEPDVGEWIEFVEAYHSHFADVDGTFNTDAPEPDAKDFKIVRYHLLAYLMSMSFKDCSLILNLYPNQPAAGKVSVIDLDPKTVRKIAMWEALDKDIVRSYAKLPLEKRKVCIDAWGPAASTPTDQALESDEESNHADFSVESEKASDPDTVRFLVVLTMVVVVFSFVIMPIYS